MKRLLALMPLISLAHADTKLVYMREDEQGKHIVLKHDSGEELLTQGEKWHLYPDITADGSQVTWVEGPSDKNLSVVLFELKTKKRTRFVTKTEGMSLHPRFSKNGLILFFSMSSPEGNRIAYFSLASVKAEGTDVVALSPELVPHEGQGYFPRPSADGSFVIFQRNVGGKNGKREIVEYNFLSQKTQVLGEGMSPALSSDETWVAYTTKRNGSWDIVLLNRRSGESKIVTHDPESEMAPTFDSRNKVVFAANRSGKYQLYRLELEDEHWVPLTDGKADYYAPNFSGDTTLLQSVLPPFPGPLRSSFASIEHNGKIYLCGGHKGSEHTYPAESFADDFQVYDPETQTWTELPRRPHKAHGFQMAASGRYLYAFGGFAYDSGNKPAWTSLDVIDRYDIEKKEWATIGKLPRRRSSNVAVAVGDRVYLMGGWDATPKFFKDRDGTFQKSVDIFDLKTETAYEAAWSLPDPLRRAFSAVAFNGKILLVGGIGAGASHFNLLSKVTEVEPETGTSREISALPFPTFAPAAEVLGDELLVFGGMYKVEGDEYEYVANVYALNLKTLRWRHTGRALKETKGFSQVVRFGNGLGVLGGHHYYSDRDEPVNTFEFFTE